LSWPSANKGHYSTYYDRKRAQEIKEKIKGPIYLAIVPRKPSGNKYTDTYQSHYGTKNS
jgi:hypothetical protein